MQPFDQLDPNPHPSRQKMPLGKVMLLNFGIMIAYMLIGSFSFGSGNEASMGVLAWDAFLILGQVGLNMLIGIILLFREPYKLVGSAMLSSGVLMA
ncbi:MAG: hypothetical protein Q7U74_15235, partial [Saprospiraceae bacterium]|nr:hypothetical protein [Saprospiraceae bacterium]